MIPAEYFTLLDYVMDGFIPFVFDSLASFLGSAPVFPFTVLFLLLSVIKVALFLLSGGTRVR